MKINLKGMKVGETRVFASQEDLGKFVGHKLGIISSDKPEIKKGDIYTIEHRLGGIIIQRHDKDMSFVDEKTGKLPLIQKFQGHEGMYIAKFYPHTKTDIMFRIFDKSVTGGIQKIFASEIQKPRSKMDALFLANTLLHMKDVIDWSESDKGDIVIKHRDNIVAVIPKLLADVFLAVMKWT